MAGTLIAETSIAPTHAVTNPLNGNPISNSLLQ
jgi:hypothetical protein